MLKRWLAQTEWLNLAVILLSVIPLVMLSLQTIPADNTKTVSLFYIATAAGLFVSFYLKKNTRPATELTGFAWLEQTLLLALLLTLLWLFYLPLAPFSTKLAAILWLSCQLVFLGLALRCWIFWREQAQQGETTSASSHLSTDQTWLIGYASQSGMAEKLARQSAASLQKAGFAVDVSPLNSLTAINLPAYQKALFVVSTYGEGEPPDNASQFYQLAQQWQGSLTGLQFAVLALGDRSYQQFCAFGHWLYQWLATKEAAPLQKPIELDSATDTKHGISAWQALLGKLTNTQPEQLAETGWQQARLHSRYCINPASPGLPCFVVKLLSDEKFNWQAGDLLEIQPENSKCTVTLWLTKHNLNGCQSVRFQHVNMPLCWALSRLQLPANPPQVGENIDIWLQQQILLPIRTYSIASIPAEDQLMLLVRQVQLDDGELGIGSGWLTAYASEMQPMQVRLRQHSNFHLPQDDRPIIFIGNGTGIAGLRALIAERVQRYHNQNWLIFGERKQETDFFFAKDIQQWQATGYLPQTDFAYSRDSGSNKYVQDALLQQIDTVKQWVANGAAIYVCGSLKGMGSSVHQILTEHLGTEELQHLLQQGRYRRDLY